MGAGFTGSVTSLQLENQEKVGLLSGSTEVVSAELEMQTCEEGTQQGHC